MTLPGYPHSFWTEPEEHKVCALGNSWVHNGT